ncbi:hypothetical protein Tco_1296998 [Tanacetum coccineum]
MSLFKVPKKVLQRLENIRCHFFHGIENNERKPIWVWHFRTQIASLRAKFIKGIHGNDGKLGSIATYHHPSIWFDIVHEVESLKHQGIDLSGFIQKKIGKGNDTLFWEDVWKGEVAFKLVYRIIYALDSCKNDTVAVKLSRNSMDYSFRRALREADMMDRWVWTLEGSGEFFVASIRRLIDKRILPEVSTKTRWITGVPIKVNIHAWKVKLDCLPTRLNIEEINHWWDISFMEVSSYEEWLNWLLNLLLHSKPKHLLEGVCYISWWLIWTFRNKTIFDLDPPSQSSLFEDVVARSFNWCRYKCHDSFHSMIFLPCFKSMR